VLLTTGGVPRYAVPGETTFVYPGLSGHTRKENKVNTLKIPLNQVSIPALSITYVQKIKKEENFNS